MKWLRTLSVAMLALLLLSGTALAVVYVYKAIFTGKVVVEPGTPGLSVAPAQLDFGVMAVGEWSDTAVLTISNIGTEPVVSFFFEMPEGGLSLYVDLPPMMPLAPGGTMNVPMRLKADDTVGPGSYALPITVVGVK